MKTPPPTLEMFLERMQRLQAQPGLGKRALGVAEWDAQLWQLGRAALQAPADRVGTTPIGGDVYLATQLYPAGGHTALMGDFIRALNAPSQVIVTNALGHNKPPLSEKICARLGLPASSITLLSGPSLAERGEQLLAQLLALQPRRLFLFHHPEDPLACVAAQPELAGQCVLVHHADSTPSFGLHLPGVRLIELNPIAAAMSRLLGLAPALLRLTVPDPGPRPGGFLQRGHLVTATSGSQHKYTKPYVYNYAQTVAVILQATRGRHLHIGPLDAVVLDNIHAVLGAAKVPLESFLHVPWTPSVAACLWEHSCDVYCASFPIDGARTDAEVLASGTPHLRHSTRPDNLSIEGGMVWNTWADLTTTLQSLTSAELLAEKSRLLRRAYEQRHHPHIFAETLNNILHDGEGAPDSQQPARDQRVIHSLMKSLTTSLIHQAERIEHLESLGNNAGRSLRARFLRWLQRG